MEAFPWSSLYPSWAKGENFKENEGGKMGERQEEVRHFDIGKVAWANFVMKSYFLVTLQ